MFLEEPQGQQDQIVEIDGVAGVQGAIRSALRMCSAMARDAFVGERCRLSPPFLKRLSKASIAAGSIFSPLAEMWLRIFLTAPSCSDSSVDDEIPFVAELLDVLAQNADAERMKGADGRARSVSSPSAFCAGRGSSFRDALLHFARGFVGEGHGEDMSGVNPRSIMCAMRKVMTRVLPVPAPARIRTGPLMVSTAWRCCGLSEAMLTMRRRSVERERQQARSV